MVEFKIRENSTHVEIAFKGALTLREVKDAFDFIDREWQKGKALIMDLAGLTDIDTMGYQLFLHWKIRAKAQEQKLHYVNHSSAVLSALDLFGGVAEMGDKIKLQPADRHRYAFNYGATKH